MKVVLAHEVKMKVMKYARYERDHIAVVTEGLNQADVLGITRNSLAVEFEIKVSRADLQKELAAIKYATMTMLENKNLASAEPDTEQMALNIELGKLKNKSGGWSKISKHQEYVDPKGYFEKHHIRRYFGDQYIPNQFYIVCPDKLVDLAIEGTKGTGYGVIAYDGCRQKDNHSSYFYEGKWYDRYEDKPDGAIWKSGAPCNENCYQEIAVRQKARKIHTNPISDNVITIMLQRTMTENITMLEEIVSLSKQVEELKQKVVESEQAMLGQETRPN